MGWNPFKAVSNFISDAAPTIGTMVGSYFGGPIGAAAGNALGNMSTGNKPSFKGSATAAATTAASSYFGSGGGSVGGTSMGSIDPSMAGFDSAGGSMGFGQTMGGIDPSMASFDVGMLGQIDPSMSGFDAGGGQFFSSAPGGGGSYYDQMTDWLKQKYAATSGKTMGRMAAGAYGLYRSNQNRQLMKLPDPASIQSLPGYRAGLDAVQASMAQQGYTGGSNAAAAMGKYGADFYNQAVQQRQSSAVSPVGEMGALALLFGG